MIKRFNRYELKYIIPVRLLEPLIENILEFAAPDAYGGVGGYPLVSLYYDSPAYDCFWAKIEGIKFRRKLRVRIYPKNPIETTTNGMVEIKQRINKTVQKKRIKVPLDEADILCNTGFLNTENMDEMDKVVVNEVKYMVESMSLRPTCITAYNRKAFVGRDYNPGLRITFDTNVSYRTRELVVNASADNRLILPEDYCVMEVKANHGVPDWVTSMLARFDCELMRISKYCAGIAASEHQHVMSLAMTPLAYIKERM